MIERLHTKTSIREILVHLPPVGILFRALLPLPSEHPSYGSALAFVSQIMRVELHWNRTPQMYYWTW